MSRRNDRIISIYKGFQIMSKKKGSVFFQNPQGACLSLTIDFMRTFMDRLAQDPQFNENFYSNKINYLPVANESLRPDRKSIGTLCDYEIIKTDTMGAVFVREPMGAYLEFPIEVIEYTLDILDKSEFKHLFQ